MIACACCPLHFFLGQLQGMMKLVVCDVWAQEDPLLGFAKIGAY